MKRNRKMEISDESQNVPRYPRRVRASRAQLQRTKQIDRVEQWWQGLQQSEKQALYEANNDKARIDLSKYRCYELTILARRNRLLQQFENVTTWNHYYYAKQLEEILGYPYWASGLYETGTAPQEGSEKPQNNLRHLDSQSEESLADFIVDDHSVQQKEQSSSDSEQENKHRNDKDRPLKKLRKCNQECD